MSRQEPTAERLKRKASENMQSEWDEMKELFRDEIKRECLQAIAEEVKDLYGDAMAFPETREGGWNSAIEEVLEIITKHLDQ